MKSIVFDSYNRDCFHGAWSNWNTLADKGHEIASHSMTHPALPNVPADLVRRELLYSKRRIMNRLGIPGPLTFGFPYNQSSPEVKKQVEKYYLAARVGGHGINIPGEIDFYNVSSWWPLAHTPLEETLDKIREAKAKNAWLVIGLHGMDDEGWHPISTVRMDRILQFLANDETCHVDTFKSVVKWLKRIDVS